MHVQVRKLIIVDGLISVVISSLFILYVI